MSNTAILFDELHFAVVFPEEKPKEEVKQIEEKKVDVWYERAVAVRSDWEREHPGFVLAPFTKDWDILDSMINGVGYGPLCDVRWVDIFKTTYFPLNLLKGTSLDYYVNEEMKRQGGKALTINRKRAKIASADWSALTKQEYMERATSVSRRLMRHHLPGIHSCR